jgi:hypothetical protein
MIPERSLTKLPPNILAKLVQTPIRTTIVELTRRESVAHYLGLGVLVSVVFGIGVEYLAMICQLPPVFFQMSTS